MEPRPMTSLAAPLLSADDWLEDLREICRDAALAEVEDQADLLRVARALLSVGPDALAPVGGWAACLPAIGLYEAMLEVGACESAAIGLLPPGAVFMLSRGGEEHGGCLATVTLEGREAEMTSQGESPALALLSALAAALIGGRRVARPAGGKRRPPWDSDELARPAGAMVH